MFQNDPEHCLKRISLIEDEDNILSNQNKYNCICLGLSQAKNQLGYAVYMYNTVQTNCWEPV